MLANALWFSTFNVEKENTRVNGTLERYQEIQKYQDLHDLKNIDMDLIPCDVYIILTVLLFTSTL